MFYSQLIANFSLFWKPLIEIIILWYVIYQVMLFFEGSKAVQAIRGIIILLICFVVFQKLDLEILDWLLNKLLGVSVIAILIVFHPEIRQGLAKLGRRNLFASVIKEEELDYVLKQIGKAVENLSKEKSGAIIAIEKNDSLSVYAESGVMLDARASSELIESVFSRSSILHDGAMIIQHGRIIAAGCLFPLSDKQDLNRMFGTRHRAALGLSEEVDALVLVISEERQDISLIYQGRMYRDLSKEELIDKIKDFLKNN